MFPCIAPFAWEYGSVASQIWVAEAFSSQGLQRAAIYNRCYQGWLNVDVLMWKKELPKISKDLCFLGLRLSGFLLRGTIPVLRVIPVTRYTQLRPGKHARWVDSEAIQHHTMYNVSEGQWIPVPVCSGIPYGSTNQNHQFFLRAFDGILLKARILETTRDILDMLTEGSKSRIGCDFLKQGEALRFSSGIQFSRHVPLPPTTYI